MRYVRWAAPGPGSWELDASHCNGPSGRYYDDFYPATYAAGFRCGFREVGVPLRTIEIQPVHGWHYFCVRPLAGPAEPKGPPPRLLMNVLFSLLPELRRRRKRAETLFDERPWREQLRRWRDVVRPSAVAAMRRLESEDETSLDDEQLARLAVDVTERCKAQLHWHFAHGGHVVVAQGDFMVHAQRWAGAPASVATRAVAGFSEATRAPLTMLHAVVDALRDDDALDVLERPAAQVERAIGDRSATAAAALAAYLEAYGLHLVSGNTVFDPTLAECPDVWVGALRARAHRPADEDAPRRRAERLVEQLSIRVPRDHRAKWNRIVADAQAMTNLRDCGGGLAARAIGLTRRTMLELGRRLVASGRAEEAESALDLTLAEALAALRGDGPSRDEIREHTAERRAQGTLTPPPRLGSLPSPPPADVFPPAVARVVRAAVAVTSRFTADSDPILGEGLAGHGASAGVVEGTARLVRGPADLAKVAHGDIIVARTTAASSFNVVLAMAAGVVTEIGGLVCHAAIVAREFGIPGVVGCDGALSQIPDGACIRVDGDQGTVTVLSTAALAAPARPAASPRPAAPTVLPCVPTTPTAFAPLSRAESAHRFGGKASALARLMKIGVRVPEGFALDPSFAEAVAARDPEHLALLHGALDAFRGPWAVRSSALSEDGVAASFAGQFRTVLGVVGHEECAEAIHEVWAAAYSPSVLAYRERLGQSEPTRMAVVVQRLVDAEVAGVLFTRDSGEHLVEACWGLGEPLVSGAIEPDRFTLDPSGAELSRTIATKSTERCRSANGGVECSVVGSARADAPCLGPDQLAALAELAARAAALFGAPQDIEFAFARSGALFCLQSRPITAPLSPRNGDAGAVVG